MKSIIWITQDFRDGEIVHSSITALNGYLISRDCFVITPTQAKRHMGGRVVNEWFAAHKNPEFREADVGVRCFRIDLTKQ